ncbi:hypothetical protein M405DRAFT_694951, partial [Rhizopogon salebrosus TDB-379]
ALNYFLESPNQQDIAEYKMSDMHWTVLTDYEKILEVPHKVQQRMSGESLPSSVCYAVPCFELFMTAWEKLAKKNP